MPTNNIATQALVVTLKAPARGGKTSLEIESITGIPRRTVNSIYAKAIRRGFEPNERPLRILNSLVKDSSRSGRPSKYTEENRDLIIAKVSTDRFGREKTAANIAGKLSSQGIEISKSTVKKILKAAGYKKTKPTRKPRLTVAIRKERLNWYIAHRNQTLEDQKAVIWSDKTSIILLHRRGGYRIQRKSNERFVRSCIRKRQKGSTEFIFQGSFTYNKKGPFHCQSAKTLAEKKEATAALEAINKELKPIIKERQELKNGMRRLKLRNLPGRQPMWKQKKETGKLTRGSKGGINWWQYRQVILIPRLLPFAKEYAKERPDTVIQEDRAPAHAHHAQQTLYDLHEVRRLLWCSNSPDLNIIKPAWPYLKRVTTKKGAPKNRKEAIRKWEAAWNDLPQSKIREWIERIPAHIRKVIEVKGRNKYLEGRDYPLQK